MTIVTTTPTTLRKVSRCPHESIPKKPFQNMQYCYTDRVTPRDKAVREEMLSRMGINAKTKTYIKPSLSHSPLNQKHVYQSNDPRYPRRHHRRCTI